MNDIPLSQENGNHYFERREFISTSLKAAGAAAFLGMPILSAAGKYTAGTKVYTIQEVIDIILKEVPGAPFPQTVDTIKSGSASQQVTSIVTTMFTTIDVIKESAKLGANFIIAHEPTFYNHTDDINWTVKNEIVKKKQDLLKQHNITVWRFHDYWHACRPDGILTGVLRMAGWQQFYVPGETVMKIPLASLKNIVDHLKSSLKISHLKVIGNLDEQCQRIALLPGAAGGQRQISIIENEKPDVLIVGEVNEWETAEYIRDSRALGSHTSLIILGHCLSEEPGMQFLVEWLQPKIPGVNISHVSSGDPFTWM